MSEGEEWYRQTIARRIETVKERMRTQGDDPLQLWILAIRKEELEDLLRAAEWAFKK